MNRRVVASFMSIASTVVYLALAVAGEGGLTAFLSDRALVAVGLITFAMSAAALFSAGNVSPGMREDRSNRWVIAAFGIIGLAQGYCRPTLTG